VERQRGSRSAGHPIAFHPDDRSERRGSPHPQLDASHHRTVRLHGVARSADAGSGAAHAAAAVPGGGDDGGAGRARAMSAIRGTKGRAASLCERQCEIMTPKRDRIGTRETANRYWRVCEWSGRREVWRTCGSTARSGRSTSSRVARSASRPKCRSSRCGRETEGARRAARASGHA